MVFYFTDNLVTYFITAAGASWSPQLHELITLVKLTEMELRITLAVVHVPGVVMIEQGTNGQSQGVWVTPLHAHLTQTASMWLCLRPWISTIPGPSTSSTPTFLIHLLPGDDTNHGRANGKSIRLPHRVVSSTGDGPTSDHF